MVAHIDFEGRTLTCREDETLLDAQLRQGANVPFSCKRGICHVCMQHCAEGQVPAEARAGLRPSLVRDGYFLPCRCHPNGDMRVTRPDPTTLFQSAVVLDHQRLSDDVCLIRLGPTHQMDHRPGQFIQLRRADGLTRSYALASLIEDCLLEIHVRRLARGSLSQWLTDELKIGMDVEVAGAMGSPFVDDPLGDRAPWLLLAGETGMAPLSGLLREALARAPARPIRIVHEAPDRDGHYLDDALTQLADDYPSLSYTTCLNPAGSTTHAELIAQTMATPASVAGKQIFLAGPEGFVADLEAHLAALGVPPESVHARPFMFRDLRRKAREDEPAPLANRPAPEREDPPPDPELWHALDDGRRLNAILDDFYTRVFADERLSPFFHATTRRRAIEKQFLFLRQLMTDEKVYFGDRPRNAHHWMVISDELFNYRARLLARCMRAHGLDEAMIGRWLDIEEHFRDQIVKREPIARVMNGVELPLDGFEEAVMEVGTLCDSCQSEIAAGETVRYHRRTGHTYCSACMGYTQAPAPTPRKAG